ncbi:MAG: tyrosine recombinase XerC [Oscillospiraceae bacterium]
MNYTNIDDIPLLLKEFLSHIYAINNKSALTVDEYALDLKLFLRFTVKNKGLCSPTDDINSVYIKDLDIDFFKSITLLDAYYFMSYCKDVRDNHEATRARKVASIRAFFKYLTVQRKLLIENPMQELETPKKKKSLPKYLTLEESLKLLDTVDGKFKERDYCILVLFLNCGLRLSELVSINYNRIKDNNTLTVLGKGNKERTIYLNNACIDAVKNYMKVRPVDGVLEKDKDALFLSSRLKRISPKTVQHMVDTYLDKAGLGGRGLSTHKLRHTAATLMYQHGKVDVLVLKDILGHENLGTTEIYTHLVDDQLKKASEQNPLANVKQTKK